MEHNYNNNGLNGNGSAFHVNGNGSTLHNAPEDSDLFDIKKVVGNIVAHWYYFAIGLVGMLLLAFLYIRYTNPVYEIDAGIMVEDQNQSSSSASALSSGASMFQDLGGVFNMTSTVDN